MKILNVKQGSEEWLDARRGVLTASNFSKVVTSTGKPSKSQDDLVLELVAQSLLDEVEETFMSDDMHRGMDLEPLARRAYQEETFNAVDEVGFMVSDSDEFGYSPDGIIDDDGLIEIKCPKAKNHLKYLSEEKLPTKYVAQVQGGLLVSGRKWCDFVSFHPDIKLNEGLFIVRVERDEDFIAKLLEEIDSVIEQKNEILHNLKKGKKI